jgi:hypothetical protein
MFISRRSHSEIVTLYEARLKDAEKRLAKLEDDCVFYRNAWLDRLGVKYPIPRPAEVTAITPSAPVTVPSEREERKTFRLDTSAWTVDEREFYKDYHVTPSLKEGVPSEEMDYHYFQKYGNQSPLTVFIDRSFPT